MGKLVHFFSFIFGPLFTNGRWAAWVLALLLLMAMGSIITAIRMEIPSREQVIKIKGTFLDTSKGYTSRAGRYSIGITDTNRNIYKCSCVPLANEKCLGRRAQDHSEIMSQLYLEITKKYSVHKAMLKWLDGKEVEVWMYPNRSVFGYEYSCYQISDSTRIHLSFEKSVEEYTKAKSEVDVYLFCLILLSASLLILIFVIVRINLYFKGNRNG